MVSGAIGVGIEQSWDHCGRQRVRAICFFATGDSRLAVANRLFKLSSSSMSEPLPVRATYFEKPRTCRIDGGRLIVTPVVQPGGPLPAPVVIPLADVVAVRLSHYPARFQFNRFRCTVTTRAGATHTISNTFWAGPITEKDFSAEYRAFVTALCRSVATASPEARFLRGRARATLIVENGVLALLFAALIGVWVWLRPGLRWFQILNLALIIAYAPLAVLSWRKNRSGVFDPRAVPPEIMPALNS